MNKEIFIERRKQLVEKIKTRFSSKDGAVFLWAHFESAHGAFCQDATFFYFTGISESALAIKIDFNGKTTLFIPDTNGKRKQWMAGVIEKTDGEARRVGVDAIEYFGEHVSGYALSPLFAQNEYKNLLHELEKSPNIFTCYPLAGFNYVQQVSLIDRLKQWHSLKNILDISDIVAQMRREKDKDEVAQIFNAVRITTDAIISATELINEEDCERDVLAGLTYGIIAGGAREAFPSIVAAGKNATILHYADCDTQLKKNELLLIDCGASYNHYCADLSRTVPISGKFTQRQRAIYAIVLACQDYIASLVKPGMWLNNKEKPHESLQHLAVEFFEKKGYAQYFTHGIGHYLGLEPHDVGSMQEPLREGDVITLEPGLYLPEENIGVRIEDDYWVIKDGVHCLSEEL